MSKSKTTPTPIPESEELRNTVGRRLRIAREILGLNRAELAEATGFSPSNITRCEAGKRLVSAELAIALRIRLGVSERFLFYGDGPAIASSSSQSGSWTSLDEIIDDLSGVLDRLQAWRAGAADDQDDDRPKPNAEVVGDNRRPAAEAVVRELKKKKPQKK